MSATITIAKEIITGRIFHIDTVAKTKGEEFECCECKQKLSPVKTEARGKDWHFRHLQTTDILKCRSTALHDFAVQVLMENTRIAVSKKLIISFAEPRKEIIVFGKRSDVTVNYENAEVHFEVFVTHDLEQEKIDIFKANKVKCVRIDLSANELLTASPEKIKDAVLNEYRNKTIIYWQDEVLKPYAESESDFSWRHVWIVIGAFIGLRFLYKHFFKPKRRNL